MVPRSFKNIEKGQWVVFLKKGSHGARFSGLVSKVEKGIQGLQGFYFFCANCIKRDELIEPTGPNHSFHFV